MSRSFWWPTVYFWDKSGHCNCVVPPTTATVLYLFELGCGDWSSFGCRLFTWILINVGQRRWRAGTVIGEMAATMDGLDHAPTLYSVTIINNNHNVLGMFIDLIILLVKVPRELSLGALMKHITRLNHSQQSCFVLFLEDVCYFSFFISYMYRERCVAGVWWIICLWQVMINSSFLLPSNLWVGRGWEGGVLCVCHTNLVWFGSLRTFLDRQLLAADIVVVVVIAGWCVYIESVNYRWQVVVHFRWSIACQ